MSQHPQRVRKILHDGWTHEGVVVPYSKEYPFTGTNLNGFDLICVEVDRVYDETHKDMSEFFPLGKKLMYHIDVEFF